MISPEAYGIVFFLLVLAVVGLRELVALRYPERLPEPDRSALRRPEVDQRWIVEYGRVRYE